MKMVVGKCCRMPKGKKGPSASGPGVRS